MDLSIIIVNYNTCDLLRQCLRTIFLTQQGIRFEVIVVDNHSGDGSADTVREKFPQVRLIRNFQNEGFSAANNRAFPFCQGDFLLLLNPDTILLPGLLRRMVSFLRVNPKVGAAGCRLEKPGGGMDMACRRSFPRPAISLFKFLRLEKLFPKSRFFSRYNLTFLDPKGNYEVDSLVGAFLMVRKEILEKVGGLDERFFLYGEDIDWCYRIRQAKWSVFYMGECRALHYKGASSRQGLLRKNYHFHRAMILFYRKHLASGYPFILNGLIYTAVAARFFACTLGHLLARFFVPSLFRKAAKKAELLSPCRETADLSQPALAKGGKQEERG